MFFLLLCPSFNSSVRIFFVMPGILCRGEITVTCQSSIKRGKIPALTFSRSLVSQTRTGRLRGSERKDKRVPSVSVECPVFQTHPKLILHLCFLVLSLRSPHPSPCSHLSSLTPPASELLKRPRMVTLIPSGDSLTSSVSTKVPHSLFTTLEHLES